MRIPLPKPVTGFSRFSGHSRCIAMKRIFSRLGRALDETGHAIDRIGIRSIEKPQFKEAGKSRCSLKPPVMCWPRCLQPYLAGF